MLVSVEFPHRGGQAGDGAGLRVLVPLDETPQAQRALLYAGSLAGATNGRLELLRATDTEDETSFNSLAQHAERLRALGVDVEFSVVQGVDAVSAILDAARTWRPDLIVMATTRTSGFDRWLNGSVTEAVVKAAEVPVLVVPPEWAPRTLSLDQAAEEATRTLQMPGSDRPGRGRILVPLDGSSVAEQALGVAIRFAELVPADLVVPRVVDHGLTDEGKLAHAHSVLAAMRGERRLPTGPLDVQFGSNASPTWPQCVAVHGGHSSSSSSCATIPPSENPSTSHYWRPRSSRKASACAAMPATLSGTVPVDRPTPALSKRMISRPDASGSVTARVPVVEGPGEVLEQEQWQARTRAEATVCIRFEADLEELRRRGDLARDGRP